MAEPGSDADDTQKILALLTKNSADDFSSIKDINYIKIVNLIHTVRSISRAEIARRLNLSKTTVSAVVRNLLKDDIIREMGPGSSFTGRKPVLLEFNKNIKVSVGIEIDDNECIGILTDLYAHPIGDPVIVAIEEDSQAESWRGQRAVLQTISELTSNVDDSTVLGVCIGIPGIYDVSLQTIMVAESMGMDHYSVHKLEKSINYPISIINRANAAVLGEKWYGVARKVHNMIYISIGNGIGAGIIINDNLFTGSTGSAGEIGHTTVLPNGPLCRCGSNGCLESLVSIDHIISTAKEFYKKDKGCLLRKYIEKGIKEIDLKLILQAAREGDASCRKLLNQQAEYFGIALANAINILDPQLIVIGGKVGFILGDYLIPTIKTVISERAEYFKNIDIVVSKLGRLATSIGASAYLISTTWR
jgi:predicted NBD/HSP70 family sugar kinase